MSDLTLAERQQAYNEFNNKRQDFLRILENYYAGYDDKHKIIKQIIPISYNIPYNITALTASDTFLAYIDGFTTPKWIVDAPNLFPYAHTP